MAERDDLDRLIDSALGTYAEPPAPAGLGERVLARIAATGMNPAANRRGRRRRWLPWTLALPVAAGVLFVLFSSPRIRHTEPSVPTVPPRPTLQAGLQPLAPATKSASKAEFRPVHRDTGRKTRLSQSTTDMANAKRLPKLDVFPYPQPPSPEERALAEFAVFASESERKALLESRQSISDPLSIPAIHIDPLQTSEPDSK